jgi:SAM-dependent methyltransferase
MVTRAQHVAAGLRRFPPAYQSVTFALESLGFARRRSQIRKYFASERDFAGLQVGAGRQHLDGWLTTDLLPRELRIVYMNASKRFPFRDGTFDYVVAEHIIEHLTFANAMRMLRECHRVLKDDGVLRVSTPDLRLVLQLLDPPLTAALERYVSWSNQRYDGNCDSRSAVHVANRLQHDWGHQFLYDTGALIAALEQCGFTEITECTPCISSRYPLVNVDRHADEIGEEFNRLESLIVEAMK